MRVLALMLLIAFAPAADAQTRAPAEPRPKLQTPAAPLRDPGSDPSLVSPTLQRTARPQHGMGVGTCRSACSRANYFCLADGGYDCGVRWSQCVAACPR